MLVDDDQPSAGKITDGKSSCSLFPVVDSKIDRFSVTAPILSLSLIWAGSHPVFWVVPSWMICRGA